MAETNNKDDADKFKEELTERQIDELKIAFEAFDKDGNGYISTKELGTAMRSLGQNPSDTELHAMINQVDIDGNGIINYPEFLELMTNKLAVDDKEEGIREVFRAFDVSDTGHVSTDELRFVLKNLRLPEEEIEGLIEELDITGCGQISYEEFAMMFDK